MAETHHEHSDSTECTLSSMSGKGALALKLEVQTPINPADPKAEALNHARGVSTSPRDGEVVRIADRTIVPNRDNNGVVTTRAQLTQVSMRGDISSDCIGHNNVVDVGCLSGSTLVKYPHGPGNTSSITVGSEDGASVQVSTENQDPRVTTMKDIPNDGNEYHLDALTSHTLAFRGYPAGNFKELTNQEAFAFLDNGQETPMYVKPVILADSSNRIIFNKVYVGQVDNRQTEQYIDTDPMLVLENPGAVLQTKSIVHESGTTLVVAQQFFDTRKSQVAVIYNADKRDGETIDFANLDSTKGVTVIDGVELSDPIDPSNTLPGRTLIDVYTESVEFLDSESNGFIDDSAGLSDDDSDGTLVTDKKSYIVIGSPNNGRGGQCFIYSETSLGEADQTCLIISNKVNDPYSLEDFGQAIKVSSPTAITHTKGDVAAGVNGRIFINSPSENRFYVLDPKKISQLLTEFKGQTHEVDVMDVAQLIVKNRQSSDEKDPFCDLNSFFDRADDLGLNCDHQLGSSEAGTSPQTTVTIFDTDLVIETLEECDNAFETTRQQQSSWMPDFFQRWGVGGAAEEPTQPCPFDCQSIVPPTPSPAPAPTPATIAPPTPGPSNTPSSNNKDDGGAWWPWAISGGVLLAGLGIFGYTKLSGDDACCRRDNYESINSSPSS